jgi:hypothetical protein
VVFQELGGERRAASGNVKDQSHGC